MTTKICCACKLEKPREGFYANKSKGDGLSTICKPCGQAHSRSWRKQNQEKVLSYFQDPEKMRGYWRSWYNRNIEQERLRSVEYGKNNPATRNAKNSRYRASQLQATPAWADPKKIRDFYVAADFLGMVTGEWHEVDHIVPLRSKLVCGLHVEHNMQVITARENASKGNRHWPDMP
jgi:hypothetical protein